MVVMMGTGFACVQSKRYTPTPPTIPQLRLPQNDAYQGSVLRVDLRPRFAWEPATANVDDIRYQLQVAPDRSFETITVQIETEQTSYQPDEVLPVSMSPPVGQRYYWRVRACVEKQCSEYSRTWWINLGRSIKDFNGDGFDDVIAGLHASEEPSASFGQAYVYFGGPGPGFDTTADGVLTGRAAGSAFGFSVSPAGDFNSDGFADLLVGAPLKDGSGFNAGTAYLFFGGAGEIFDTTPDAVMSGHSFEGGHGTSVSAAGDVDGNGFADFLVGAPGENRAYLYFGGRKGDGQPRPPRVLTSTSTGGRFGAAVAGAGDVNGDGYADVLISNSSYSLAEASLRCAADLFLGSSDQRDTPADGLIAGAIGEKCSLKAMGAGDVNGDGFSDVLAKINLTREGALLFRGASTLPLLLDTTLEVPAGHTCREVSSVGDINGDGVDDVALVDQVSPTTAQLQLHFGRPRALQDLINPSVDGQISGGSPTAPLFGWVVRGAGDLDADGFDDLITANPSNEGQVYMFFGNGGSPFDTRRMQIIFSFFLPDGQFGYSVAAR
jgi:hypothetical protein